MPDNHSKKPSSTQPAPLFSDVGETGDSKSSAGEIAAEFLNSLDPDGTHHLAALCPETDRMHGRTFPKNKQSEIAEWVDERNGKFNLYYAPNEARADFEGAKPSDKDMVSIRAIYSDIDLAGPNTNAALSSLLEKITNGLGSLEPSALVKSGGGYQALFWLDEKLGVTAENKTWAKSCGNGVRDLLKPAISGQAGKVDTVSDLSRIMRLPGTENLPTKTKLEQGKVQRTARVIKESGLRFSQDEISISVQPQSQPDYGTGDADVEEAMAELEREHYQASYADLPDDLRSRFEADLDRRPALKKLWEDGLKEKGDDTGSGRRASLATSLHNIGGYAVVEFASLVWGWQHAVQNHDEQIREKKLNVRQLAKVWVDTGSTVDRKRDPRTYFDDIPEPKPDCFDEQHAKEVRKEQAKPDWELEHATKFVDGFIAPEFILDGVVQRGKLYTLTAPTGTGKTAVVLYVGLAMSLGLDVCGRETEAGDVLYLAGENPDDVRARVLGMSDAQKLDLSACRLHVIAGTLDIRKDMALLKDAVSKLPNPIMIIVDTFAAYYDGDGFNNNKDMLSFTKVLRDLTESRGKPAVIAPSHPTKNAGKDSLVPFGGGTFLNEVDGNLCLWKEGKVLELFPGKLRGKGFEKLQLELETVMSEKVKDRKGRIMPTVMAVPLSEARAAALEDKSKSKDDRVLLSLDTHPDLSMDQRCIDLGMMNATGRIQKSSLETILKRFEREKLVSRARHKWQLTTKGTKAVREVTQTAEADVKSSDVFK